MTRTVSVKTPPEPYPPIRGYARPKTTPGIGIVKIFRRSVEVTERRDRCDPKVSPERAPDKHSRIFALLRKKRDDSRISTDMLEAEELLIPTIEIASDPLNAVAGDMQLRKLKPGTMMFGYINGSADIHVSTLVPKLKVKI